MTTETLLPTSKNFRRLTIITSCWVFLLIVFGAVVRVTGSGMGCPDWPLCYNQVIPPSQMTAWIEVIHRVVAGIASLLSVTVAIVAWRHYRSQRLIVVPAMWAVGIVFFQAFLGAVTVWLSNHPLTVIAHLLAAMSYLAVTLFLTTVVHIPTAYLAQAGVSTAQHKSFLRFLLLAGVAVLFVLISGATVTGTGSSLACLDWPLCQGEIFPANVHLGTIIHLFHRYIVVAVGVLIAAVVLQIRRHYTQYPLLVKWATALGLLFLAQIVVGGINVLLRFPRIINAAHLGLAAAIWGSVIILATVFYLTTKSLSVSEEETGSDQPLSLRQRITIYFKLTKPWILVLLLITTLTAMVIAAEGVPSIPLILYTLLGGALSAGGASVLNSYVDSDIDRMMSRTSRRATVTGLITPQETLFLGLALSTLSFLVFTVFVNAVSAALSTLGILYYVFFYTLYLKRTTLHNIIIGGAAGSIPPLVGWTAITGTLDLGAFYLFAIIFFWTPPHTWALALLVRKDYAQARVPMLPVVAGEKETTYQILLYSILLVVLTLLPFTFQMVSLAYFIAAIALGGQFIYLAWKLWRNYEKSISRRLYKYSQAYLALLFLVMAIDRSLF